MYSFIRGLIVVFVISCLSSFASAETVQIKAQGISDATFGAQEKALNDAKRKALDKYITGLKSQSEANKLLSSKAKLYENIDDFVKEPTELSNEEKNGKLTIIIQAQIDVTSLNDFVEKSFNKERKKAGVKKKQIAFVFVAREVESVTAVKDHNIAEGNDNSSSTREDGNDNNTKGNSKANSSGKSTQNNEDDVAVTDDVATVKEEKSKLSKKAKGNASSTASNQGNSALNKKYSGSKNTKNTQSGEAQLEEGLNVSIDDATTDEGTKRKVSAKGKQSIKGSSTLDNKDDVQLSEDTEQAYLNNDESNESASSDLNASQASKEDKNNKFRQNKNVKNKKAKDATASESNDYATSASENNKSVVKTDNSKYAESKNTSIQHTEEKTYKVIENGTISAQFSELFTEQGMKVSESFDAGELLLSLQKAKSVNQVRPADLKKAIASAKAEGTDFLCIGTLDVDREMIDKATGNSQRYVLVNASTYDLTKPKLEKAGAVGNLNFSGLGDNPEIAKNNALSNAVREAGVKLVAQIRKHMLEEDED